MASATKTRDVLPISGDLLTYGEGAVVFGPSFTARRVRHYVERGLLTPVRLPGSTNTFVRRSEIDAMLAAGVGAPPPPHLVQSAMHARKAR